MLMGKYAADRDPHSYGRIVRTRGVCFGKYRIDQTRIPVQTIRNVLGAWDVPTILKEYPTLTEADVEAARLWRRGERDDRPTETL